MIKNELNLINFIWKLCSLLIFDSIWCILLFLLSLIINLNRLQLKRGLFWYRNYPKLHEMVKYRSSRALVWTNRSGISRRIFFNSKKCWKIIIWSKKTQQCCFLEKKYLRSKMPHTKNGKTHFSRWNQLTINSFNYLQSFLIKIYWTSYIFT